MPELPEVETVKRALQTCMPQTACRQISVFTPKLRTPLAPLLQPELLGSPVVEVRRRGRYLIMELANQFAFLIHLGMSGVIRVEPPRERRKHEHIIMDLDNGLTFRFECTRRFSIVEAVRLPAPGAEPLELAGLGVEPLSADFTGALLHQATRRKSGALKNLIMENAVVVGVGNIYATEALFQAGLHPARPAATLTRPEADRLVSAIREILTAAIAAGGTTVHDYRHIDGSEGKFVQALQLYGRSGAPCPRCGTRLQHVKLGGRTSCFCPHCQPEHGASQS